jgi:RND family efflux transporter MFP subunit
MRPLPLLLLLLTSMLLVGSGCGKPGAGGGWGDRVVPVVAATAQEQPVEDTIAAVGTLEANESIEVKSEVDGTIASIEFEEGQRVVAGQVLVTFDQAKWRAALSEAQANLRMAETTKQRYAALLQTKAVSRQEVDQANAAWAANQALVERLTAELEEATITAPFDGLAGARLLSVGQFIPRGTAITTLIDPDPMKLAFTVPERLLGTVQTGQPVTLTVAAYPDTALLGAVYFIDPEVDPDTRTVLLKATVPNADGRLRQGMFAHAELVMGVHRRAVVIPETALLYQGDLVFVYAIDPEQTVRMQPVKIGRRLADAVEVREGLRAGDRVVTEGHQKLHPGAKVAPQPPAVASAPNPV